MNERQSEAIAALCLMSALADRTIDERERERLRETFDSLGGAGRGTVYQRVILGQTSIESEVEALETPELRRLAYELALGVSNADGHSSSDEREFLAKLSAALGLDTIEASRLIEQADAVADAPLVPPLSATTPMATATVAPAPAAPPIVDAVFPPNEALVPATKVAALRPVATDAPDPARKRAVDDLIRRTAMLCGGLELLPQGMATLGIVPLQIKLVHDVGRHYGYELDRGHITEFIATIGAGMTSQIVEGYARKFLKRIARRELGWMVGSVAGVATGAAFSFASTWAIGQVASQYYAGGRRLAAIDLRRLYEEQLGHGREVYAREAGNRAGGSTTSLPALDDIFRLLRGR
jgi:uncharacterized protein (DUF697 family)/tellurite resistance protein